MAQNFLEFLNERKKFVENNEMLTEAFKTSDVEKALELITSLLKKHITTGIVMPLVGFVTTKVKNQTCRTKQFMVIDKDKPLNTRLFQFNWLINSQNAEIYSVDMFKSIDICFTGVGKSDLTIHTLGSSIVTVLPIIWTVMNTGDYSLSKKEAMKLAETTRPDGVKESLCIIGGVKYKIFENVDLGVINDTFMLEAGLSDDAKAYKKAVQNAASDAYNHRNDSPEAKERFKTLYGEYQKILDAIKGGATTVAEIQLSVLKGQQVEIVETKEEAEFENEIPRKDPRAVFKEMHQYVKMVTSGKRHGVLICGAPGVGKTYNVTHLLEKEGYVEGHNWCTLNSKCSPRQLYLTLYEYQRHGDIVLIDDCETLIGKKASDDATNILKAALDTNPRPEGRLVTYGVAGPLKDNDDNPVPKTFYYNGSVIILTNYRAGSCDSAIRSRCFVQDIDFTPEDALKLIQDRIAHINGDGFKLSAKSKIKAYNYLSSLVEQGVECDISFRSFGTCAAIYQSAEDDPDMSDEIVESMIREQMENLSATYDSKKSKY